MEEAPVYGEEPECIRPIENAVCLLMRLPVYAEDGKPRHNPVYVLWVEVDCVWEDENLFIDAQADFGG